MNLLRQLCCLACFLLILSLLTAVAPAQTAEPLRPDRESLERAAPALLDRLRADPYDYFRFVNRPWIARVCDDFGKDMEGLPVVRLHGDAHVEQFAVTNDAWGLDDFDDSARGRAVIDIARFLGSVESAEPAVAALDALAGAPGAVATIDGRPIRLGRETLALPVEGLSDLAGLVGDAFAGVGRPSERRPFRGHLTLARGRSARTLSTSRRFQRVSFRVRALSLVESHLGPSGARYETLASVELASP